LLISERLLSIPNGSFSILGSVLELIYSAIDPGVDVLRRVGELLGGISLIGSGPGSVLSGCCQSVSINSTCMHLVELIYQYPDRTHTRSSQDEREKGHPFGSRGGNPRRPVSGTLFLLLGAALLKCAFYFSDDPAPSINTKVLYFGIVVAAFICVFHGTWLIIGLS
jgi:hypothetical protein